MSETDQFFMARHEINHLLGLLDSVPQLAEDLAITETRQSRSTKPGLSNSRRPKKMGYRIPFHIGAASAGFDLQNSLAAAVRHTCEERCVEYFPVGYRKECGEFIYVARHGGFIGPLLPDQRRTPPGYDEGAPRVLARWLKKYIVSFALTEGCQEFADAIAAAIAECELQVVTPPEDVVIDEARVKAANRSVVTIGTIDAIAVKMGDLGKGLNGRRIRTLVSAKKLRHDSEDPETGTKFYRLGDVLDAHYRHAQKKGA